MMEKIGIEVEKKLEPGEKVAEARCSHPPSEIHKDGTVRFCMKCNKYLPEVGL